jgi:hypothetical protein
VNRGLGIDPEISDIFSKVLEKKKIGKEDALRLMNVDHYSIEMYMLMAIANRNTRDLFNNFGEVHA